MLELIRGIFIKELEYLLSQYADDTDMGLDAENEEEVIAEVFKELDKFHKISGCAVNYDKTTIYRTGSLRKANASKYTQQKLNWEQTSINVLGVEICEDIKKSIATNYDKVLQVATAKLKLWSNRTLSLYGKVEILKHISGIYVGTSDVRSAGHPK